MNTDKEYMKETELEKKIDSDSESGTESECENIEETEQIESEEVTPLFGREENGAAFKIFLCLMVMFICNFTKLFYISVSCLMAYHSYVHYLKSVEKKFIKKKTS